SASAIDALVNFEVQLKHTNIQRIGATWRRSYETKQIHADVADIFCEGCSNGNLPRSTIRDKVPSLHPGQ
ncbi:hypothetical protein, partial [Sinorhizobium fredii]|uniref:hypothetical protein n=1 Tax=Rhizobium fredii TaxID=380 RepID=UPI001AEC50AB